MEDFASIVLVGLAITIVVLLFFLALVRSLVFVYAKGVRAKFDRKKKPTVKQPATIKEIEAEREAVLRKYKRALKSKAK